MENERHAVLWMVAIEDVRQAERALADESVPVWLRDQIEASVGNLRRVMEEVVANGC